MPVIKLDTPYFNQTDNDIRFFGDGSRQCCLTANAMAAEHLLKTHGLETLSKRATRLGLSEPESAYGQVLNDFGDTTDHTANTAALAELGLKSYFSTSLSIDNAIASLKKGIPMPMGLHYKASGHIVCAVGVDTDNDFFYIHDPYGVRAGLADYYHAIGGQSGKYDRYSFAIMYDLWASASDGWGRVFTSVGGKPTGL